MSDAHRPLETPKGSEDGYRRLFEDSRDAIYIGTTDGRLLDINPAGVRLFGYESKAEMLSLDIGTDLYWNPEDRKRAHAVFMAQGFLEDLEIELKTRQGKRLRVRETSSAIRDAGGDISGFRGILRDVTEQRQLEEQLRQSQKMEAVGRLAEGVAHDFNNLLTAINGYSELILVQMAEDDPLHSSVSEIRKAGKRAAELTRRLLTLSRHQPVSPRKIDLNRVVADMEKLLRRVLGEDVELETLLDPELRPIYVDQGQIEQIILNLAINARDAMPDGGRLTLETAANAGLPGLTGEFVQLNVRDTGEGMVEAVRERVFEPFFTTKSRGHNTGLGLSIVYGVIQQVGGHVEVESSVGDGSLFRVFFPPAEPTSSSISPAGTVPDSTLPRGTETVLLVEDEATVRVLVQRILELQGYTVLAAQDASTAVALCNRMERHPDLLLTDVVMPKTSGPILAEGLQERFQDLKVLFMSGYTDTHSGVRLLNRQRAAFLPKPFSPEVLAHKVREVLDSSPVSAF